MCGQRFKAAISVKRSLAKPHLGLEEALNLKNQNLWETAQKFSKIDEE
jgi:hypothetical protein